MLAWLRSDHATATELRSLFAKSMDSSKPGSFGVIVNSMEFDDGVWRFSVVLTGVKDNIEVRQRCNGECTFSPLDLQWDSVVARLAPDTDRAPVVFEVPDGGPKQTLHRAKLFTGAWLLVAATASLVAALLMADKIWPDDANSRISLPSLLALSSLIGAAGSAGAAIRSFADRTAGGVEFDSEEGGALNGQSSTTGPRHANDSTSTWCSGWSSVHSSALSWDP